MRDSSEDFATAAEIAALYAKRKLKADAKNATRRPSASFLSGSSVYCRLNCRVHA
ncbi:hypothetical protein [Mesorhizobium sp. B1-1-7]|uniref:hypothetical protein n=1 Tax=Mesorhizobium sp. B1-1-7 TaxID=2589977 RepID=UPI0015E4696D|nr:hypothetical protein [Mesorhizobium sp. B1-1-7]